jgi:hypothetical protein
VGWGQHAARGATALRTATSFAPAATTRSARRPCLVDACGAALHCARCSAAHACGDGSGHVCVPAVCVRPMYLQACPIATVSAAGGAQHSGIGRTPHAPSGPPSCAAMARTQGRRLTGCALPSAIEPPGRGARRAGPARKASARRWSGRSWWRVHGGPSPGGSSSRGCALAAAAELVGDGVSWVGTAARRC